MAIYAKVLFNGSFIDTSEATIPIHTPALVGALGVYETILAKQGKYIALKEHLERLLVSAAGAQLTLAVDMETLVQWSYLVLAANHRQGLVRVLAVDLGKPSADIYMYQMSYAEPTPADYLVGVPVTLYHGERSLPQVKSFNTLVPGLARKAAIAANAHDALLVDRQGHLTEGSNCNLFIVSEGILMAPPEGTVLEGTVMARALILAQELGIASRRCPLPVAELDDWDEAFLTSTRRGILPIRNVGDHMLPQERPITRQLMAAYDAWEATILA